MGLLLLSLVLTLGTQVWLALYVKRIDVRWAWATLFLGPFGAAYPALENRYNPELKVTIPFLVNAACTLLLAYSGWHFAQQLAADAQRRAALERLDAPQAVAEAAPASAPPAAADTASAAASAPAALGGPFQSFSDALRGASVTHAARPLAEAPRGADEAVEFVVSSTTEGQATDEFTATVLHCKLVGTCRKLANAYMVSKQRPRVVQNGPMVLIIPYEATTNSNSMQGTMAVVFKRMVF
jgi:hypothetical protein